MACRSVRRRCAGRSSGWACRGKKTLIATERDEAARAAWRAAIVGWDASRVVFLDETSPHTSMSCTHGRAPRGERVVGQVPRNHGPNMTCLAALTPTGITAPLVLEGAINGPVFVQWLREWLLPTLAPGTAIVLDNLSVHRTPDARAVVEAARCHLCFLPAYSPDYNPIELAFSKLKTHLRSPARREDAALLAAIGTGLSHVSAADATAWYQHCGYQVASTDKSQPS